jgi:hypothetical protein
MISLLSVCVLSIYAIAAEGKPVNIISSNSHEIKFHVQSPVLQLKDVTIKNELFQDVILEGLEKTADDGKPALPFISTTLAIPAHGDYQVFVTPSAAKTYYSVNPKPVFAKESDERDLVYNRSFYAGSETYPSRLVEYSAPSIMRDFRIIQVNIYPVQYQSGSKQILVYEDIDVTIRFSNAQGINEMSSYQGYSPIFENLYDSMIDNFDDFRDTDQAPVNPKLVVLHRQTTDQNFIQELNNFVNWKRQKGYDVNVVSTQVAGTSNSTIKTYLQGLYNDPHTKFDYLIIMGDVGGNYGIPTWNETYSTYNGEGDYPYSHLAGDDLLGDVFMGRISFTDTGQMSTIMAKVYAYEKNVNTDPVAAAWLNRMLLVGDTSSSGISTIYTNKFVKEISQIVNPEYTYLEQYSSGFSTYINSSINQGVGFFNYRGYIGMSSWSPGSSLINGFKLPHAVIITCATGSFAGNATTEAFIQLGSAATPKGAVTAIGMATSGTHTMFNNALNGGIFDGIMTHKMRTMGEALLNGKIYLHKLYNVTHSTQTKYFAHWCNLMGDPTTEVWIGIPGKLVMTAPTTIPSGTNLVDIMVHDEMGVPVKNTSVTIYDVAGNNVITKGFTDAEGLVSLYIPVTASGSLIFTASAHNYKPAQQTASIDASGSIVYSNCFVSDSASGNGNGIAEAGETVQLTVSLKNTTASSISGISSSLTSTDQFVTITNSQSAYNSLDANAVVNNSAPFVVSIASNLPESHDIRMVLNLTDSQNQSYQCVFHLLANNSNLILEQTTMTAGANMVLDPSETGMIHISVRNNSNLPTTSIYAELRSLNDLLVVTDSLATLGDIPANAVITSMDSFSVFARPQLIPGMQIPMQIRFYNAQGLSQTRDFSISIGTVSVTTPLGPDEYGYFIYDSGDTSFPDCPTYEWVEIHPSLGGFGTLISLSDSGTSNDEGDQVGSTALAVIDLPFTFGFYGIDYSQITVCVNGFIALGVTANADFRNYRLPGALGANPMIAAFWDDLIIIQDAGVYKYYNPENHTFVIQYHKMRNGYDRSSEETFEVIFYDPIYYPTGLGDGMVKIQYKVFNNVDTGISGYTPYHGNYSTIGIKDHTNTRGLEYTYNNVYAQAAAPLSNQKALLITTTPVLHQNPYLVISDTYLHDSNNNNVVEPGESVELGIKLSNLGLDTARNVRISVSSTSANVTFTNSVSTYDNITGSGNAVNQQAITMTISQNCPDNAVIQLTCYVNINGNSWQYPTSFVVKKPALNILKKFINDAQGNGNGIAEPGESFKLIVNFTNNTTVEARNVTSNILCLDTRVTILNPEQILSCIPAGMTAQATYDVTFSNQVQTGNFITFYLSYLGDLIDAQNEQIMVSCGITGMNSTFESSNGDFVPSPTTNGWQWGVDNTVGAHSGTKVWGTRLNNQYPNNVTYSLVSPSIYIGPNFGLEFWHYYNIEPNYDGGNVKISTNNGNSWILLTPDGGYTNATLPALNEAGYSGSSDWTLAKFNLSSYANQTVQFKWTFASDQGVQNIGWFIDDVQTTGYLEFATQITGALTSGNPELEMSSVLINSDSNMITHPLNDGTYNLYLPLGTYAISASCPGYLTESVSNIATGITIPSVTHDFYLAYFKPVTNLSYSVNEAQLNLNWQIPVEPEFAPIGYRVYRRLNAGDFELYAEVIQNSFAETLSDLGTYKFYITSLYANGESTESNIIGFSYPNTSNLDPNQIPLITKLYNNYPNPFNPTTNIAFSIKTQGNVKLSVYNLKGQLVKTLANTSMAAGQHSVVWNGTDNNNRSVGSGIYLYRLETKDYTQTRKAMLMK